MLARILLFTIFFLLLGCNTGGTTSVQSKKLASEAMKNLKYSINAYQIKYGRLPKTIEETQKYREESMGYFPEILAAKHQKCKFEILAVHFMLDEDTNINLRSSGFGSWLVLIASDASRTENNIKVVGFLPSSPSMGADDIRLNCTDTSFEFSYGSGG